MIDNIPMLDKRSEEDILKEIREKIAYYVPEWSMSLENPDAGTALAVVFAEMFYGTLKRFNRVPYKNYLAYLNMLNADLKSMMPAQGYVAFQLSQGIDRNVKIEKGTQVFASVEGAEEGRVVFETVHDFYASPARLQKLYFINPAEDNIVAREPGDVPFGWFDFDEGENLQKHRAVIEHQDVLWVKSPARIMIQIGNEDNRYQDELIAKKLADETLVKWKYRSGDEWKAFDEIESRDNTILLKKDNYEAVEGAICCDAINIAGVRDILTDYIKLGSEYLFRQREGTRINPDFVFFNDNMLTEEGGFCFGKSPVPYDCLYIASEEVFTKKGAEIEIEMDLRMHTLPIQNAIEPQEIEYGKFFIDKRKYKKPAEHDVFISTVVWEYWNGFGWTYLRTSSSGNPFVGEDGICKVGFLCPEDMEKSMLNGQENYWIRVRVREVENSFALWGRYILPWLERISLDYQYPSGNFRFAARIETDNNCEKVEYGSMYNGTQTGEKICLFKMLAEERPSVYMCFDSPLQGYPVNLFFSVLPGNKQKISRLVWESLVSLYGKESWHELKVIDRTANLSTSGIISLFTGSGFTKASRWSDEGYWIRVSLADVRFNQNFACPVICDIRTNTAKIVQQETHREDQFLIESDGLDMKIELMNKPVISEEVWINEFSELTPEEMQRLENSDPGCIKTVLDDMGQICEFWIKWQCKEDFHQSKADDRHYTIDRYEGIIRFGDNKKGKKPPCDDGKNIIVNYSQGGGSLGNQPEYAVNTLVNPIAYVDKVYNFEPTYGGCDRQTVDSLAQIGPQRLKNRGRAVTAKDYVYLVMENFIEAAKIKCFSNVTPEGKPSNGYVTLIAMSHNYLSPRANLDLCQRIEKFLMNRVDCGLKKSGRFSVIAPIIIKVNVTVEITVTNIEYAAEAENNIINALTNYLDPIHGVNGNGFEIGYIPGPYDFHKLIKNIKYVDAVKKVSLEGCYLKDNQLHYVALDDKADLKFAVICSGTHHVVI